MKQKMILMIFGIFFAFVLLETGLRMGGVIFLGLQEYRNRISVKQNGSYRILCLGESTTAGSYPNQLEEILNQKDIGIKFSVINKGIPGSNTNVIISQLQDNLDKYNPDMVITMMGINDDSYMKAYESDNVKKFFKSFRIYKLVSLLWFRIINKLTEFEICKLSQNIGIQKNSSALSSFCNSQKRTKEGDKEYLKSGQRYMREAEYDKAKEMFKKAIEIDSKNDMAYYELGWYYVIKNMAGKAERCFTKAIEIDPGNYSAYLELGRKCYMKSTAYDKAEEIYKRAIQVSPNNHLAYLELGYCYTLKEMYDKAEDSYKKAIGVNPKAYGAYVLLADLYKRSGKNKTAVEYYKKADNIMLEYYNRITWHNYRKLRRIVKERGIDLVCVQYPVRSIAPLKKMLEPHGDIIFVDNEGLFKKALKKARYDEYFIDRIGDDFGHCTSKGNRLLAANIAKTILTQRFDYRSGEYNK